jgi:hypothetical protein
MILPINVFFDGRRIEREFGEVENIPTDFAHLGCSVLRNPFPEVFTFSLTPFTRLPLSDYRRLP